MDEKNSRSADGVKLVLLYQSGDPQVAKSLAEIQRQIQQLEKQAQEIKSREVTGVVARIKEAIEFYGLTAEDLFGGRSRKSARKSQGADKAAAKIGMRRKAAGKKIPVKYRDDAGNTWTGRGLKPRWLTAALGAGKKLEDFQV